MSKQLNLFGEKACIATKSYVLYKSPALRDMSAPQGIV